MDQNDSGAMPHLLSWQIVIATLVALPLALVLFVQSARAQSCMQDNAGSALNCTANDIGIASATVLNSVTSCTAGADVELVFMVEMLLATSTRYDVGFFTALDGGDALTGMCSVDVLPPAPDPPFVDLDGDMCGDINAGHSPIQGIQFQSVTVPCQPGPDGKLLVNSCISWRQNRQDVCTGAADLWPGSPSKCRCQPLPLDVAVLSSLTVVKEATPNSPQNFSFTTTGSGLTNFTLDDDADGTLPNTRTFSNLADGVYTVAEAATPGWMLTNIRCLDGAGQPVGWADLSSRMVTLPLQATDVTCTFSNQRVGSIRIQKQTDPPGAVDSFAFSASLAPTSFMLQDGGSQLFSNLTDGTYTFAEMVPRDWRVSDITCTGGANSVIQIGNNGTFDSGDSGISISLADYEDIVCTFVNTLRRGAVRIDKQTVPAGVTVPFTFTTNYGAPFTLMDSSPPNNSGPLLPGLYRVSETTLPLGWSLTRATCSDGSNLPAIDLGAGETVTCTFVNTTQPAAIGIQKSASQTLIDAGAIVTYSYIVTNRAYMPLDNVTVSDDLCAPVTPVLSGGFNVGDSDRDGFLEPGESWRFTCTTTVQVDTINVATATAMTQLNTQVNASDSEFVDVRPAIALTKTPSVSSVPETGGFVRYTIVVSNTGNEPVTLNTLTDSAFGNLNGQGSCAVPQSIPVGGSYTCSFYQYLAGDFPSGHANTVVAGATDNEGNSATTSASAVVNFTDVPPSVALTKAAKPLALPEPGGPFTVTLTIRNTSGEPVTITALTDSYPLSPQCNALVNTQVAPGQSVQCQYTVTHTTPGAYTNTAAVTVVDDEGNSASASDTATVTVIDLPAFIAVSKQANPLTVSEPGGLVQFTVLVTNTSAVDTVTLTTIDDDTDNDGMVDITYNATTICNTTVLAPGAVATCTFTRNLTGSAGAMLTDVATVHAIDDDQQPVQRQDRATAVITGVGANVTMSKTPDPPSLPEPGGPVTFTIRMTNTSPAEVVTINQLNDSVFNNLTTTGHDGITATTCVVPQTLAINGGVYTCTFVAQVTGNFGQNHENIAVAAGVDQSGDSVTGVASAEVEYENSAAAMRVNKSADPASVPETGALVNYTVVVSNTSDVDLVTITHVVDDRFGDVSNSCAPTLPATLQPNEIMTCQFARFVQSSFFGAHTNTATAYGYDDDGNLLTENGSESVVIVNTPSSLAVSKTANVAQLPEGGGPVEYTIIATNTSPVDSLTVNQVVDDRFGDISATCAPALPVQLAPGQQIICFFARFVAGDQGETHANVVTVSGVDEDGDPVAGSGSTTVLFTPTPAAAALTKSATPTAVPNGGGWVTFTARIANTGPDLITFTGLDDSVYGDVTNAGNALLGETTCAMPQTLAPGAVYLCHFVAFVTGNVGDLHSNTLTATGIDDDGDPVSSSDSATVPVADPIIAATKTATLVADENGDGVANPGEVLEYAVVIRNTGNAPGSASFLYDVLDTNLTLVNGSVTATQGVVAEGNSAGDANIIVNIGDITPNSAATIRFRAQIKNPLPSGVSQVVNQGVVTGANFPSVATDDPNTPTPDDPVVTLLFAAPRLAATKTDLLVVDADSNNAPSPGDTLEYRILLVNTGNQAATGVIFDDAPDPNTQLLAGSVATSQGTVLIGNNDGDRTVRIDVGTVPAHGGAVAITFRVVIDNPLPPTVTLLANQGIFSGDNFPLTPTDDPDTLAQSDRIDTPATLDPRLRAYKRDFLLIDADSQGTPSPGDTLAYILAIANDGTVPATDVIFRDTPSAETTLVVGSVQTSQGVVTGGNGAGDTQIEINIGVIPPGISVAISYRVMINADAEALITNQAVIDFTNPNSPGSGASQTVSDDPDTAAELDPTTTPLLVPTALADETEPAYQRSPLFLPLVTR